MLNKFIKKIKFNKFLNHNKQFQDLENYLQNMIANDSSYISKFYQELENNHIKNYQQVKKVKNL